MSTLKSSTGDYIYYVDFHNTRYKLFSYLNGLLYLFYFDRTVYGTINNNV
jgi:hypothetical protein